MAGTNVSLEEKMESLELKHAEKLRKEGKWFLGVSVASVIGLIGICYGLYKDFDVKLDKELKDHRSSVKIDTELMNKEVAKIVENSQAAQASRSTIDELTSKLLTFSRELEKISKTDTAVMDRLRIKVGTYVVVAESELGDFLDEPDYVYKNWIALPGEVTLSGGGFKADKARWTLADGRNIEGSELHRQLGISTAAPPLPENAMAKDIKPVYLPSGATAITLIKINP